jgi:hypothetical protein
MSKKPSKKSEQQAKPGVPLVAHPSGGESLAQRVAPAKTKKKKKDYSDIIKKREAFAARAKRGPIDYLMREVVVDENGLPRQAGADHQEGEFIVRIKKAGERSLYFFCKGILNRHFLTLSLHKPVCDFQQLTPPFHKLTLMPREHAKTAIVSGGLPLHIIIQPADTNMYFPGIQGSECRILLAGETQDMAEKNLRVLKSVHDDNLVFRSLWPHICWKNAKRESPVWSQKAAIFPRLNEWPDPTIWAKGTDGAVTGTRPNVMIKDDLVSLEASRSDTVMANAIEWHKASRALLDSYEKESGLYGLEFIIGTRWAVYDLYSDIIDTDPSVEVIDEKFHQIIRNGKVLWPEKHTKESVAELMHYHKHMFFLLYMNNAADPNLVDFNLDDVREFRFVNDQIMWERLPDIDDALEKSLDVKEVERDYSDRPLIKRGTKLNAGMLDALASRTAYLRAKRY